MDSILTLFMFPSLWDFHLKIFIAQAFNFVYIFFLSYKKMVLLRIVSTLWCCSSDLKKLLPSLLLVFIPMVSGVSCISAENRDALNWVSKFRGGFIVLVEFLLLSSGKCKNS